MHRRFRELLTDATGSSEYVVALVVDVRGFTPFNSEVGDADTAQYVKKLYIKLVDTYFTEASFFKPTGDGLMITVPYVEGTLEEVAESTVTTALQVVDEFGSLLLGDRMITFDVPQNVGIGIARGSTMRLNSGHEVLDYAGRVINFASRLMQIARPSGVVLDGAFGIDMLSAELQSQFTREDGIYVPGIAETDPIFVWATSEYTEIPASARRPIREFDWIEIADELTLKQFIERPKWWWYRPSSQVADERAITVKVHYPLVRPSGRRASGEGFESVPFEFLLDAGSPVIRVNTTAAAEILTAQRVKPAWPCILRIRYPTH